MTEFLFIGEKRSPTAIKKDWTWQNTLPEGRLCAIQLFASLREIGIEPADQFFQNAWKDDGSIKEIEIRGTVVAMGQKVSQELDRRKIDHITIIHPAARGIIRRKENYTNHLREKLK